MTDISNIISSQDYIDEDIVADKIAAEDFEVLVSPEFSYEGGVYRVLLDGHHSLAAAIQCGAEPVFIEATPQDHDAVSLIARGEIEDFLLVTHMGADYHYAANGEAVW